MSRRVDGDIKREKTEYFWTGVCAPREGGSPKQDMLPMHWKLPHRQVEGEAGNLRKPGKAKTYRTEKRKLHFSSHKQLMNCGLDQMVGLEIDRILQKPHSAESRPRVPRGHGIQTFPAHTNLYAQRVARGGKKSMAHKPLHAHKLGGGEGVAKDGSRQPKECTSPMT